MTLELYRKLRLDAETLMLQLRELHTFKFQRKSCEVLIALYALFLNGQERVSVKDVESLMKCKALGTLHFLASKNLVHTLPPEANDTKFQIYFELDEITVNLLSIFIPFEK